MKKKAKEMKTSTAAGTLTKIIQSYFEIGISGLEPLIPISNLTKIITCLFRVVLRAKCVVTRLELNLLSAVRK